MIDVFDTRRCIVFIFFIKKPFQSVMLRNGLTFLYS